MRLPRAQRTQQHPLLSRLAAGTNRLSQVHAYCNVLGPVLHSVFSRFFAYFRPAGSSDPRDVSRGPPGNRSRLVFRSIPAVIRVEPVAAAEPLDAL